VFSQLSELVHEVDLGLDVVYDAVMEDRNTDKAMAAVKLRLSKAWVLTGKLEAIGGDDLVASAEPLMAALKDAAKDLNVLLEDAKNKPRLSEDLDALLGAQEKRQEEQVLELIRRAEILVDLNKELNKQTVFLTSVSKDASAALSPSEEPPPVVAALFAMQDHMQIPPLPPNGSPPPEPNAPLPPKGPRPPVPDAPSSPDGPRPPVPNAPLSPDGPMPAVSLPLAGETSDGVASGESAGGDDGEPIDFKKLGRILQKTPVLTEASKHLAAGLWETKKREEEFSREAADVPIGNMLPLAYAGLPKPDEALGFMPPGVDKALGLTDGILANSDEVRLGAAPIKAPKPNTLAIARKHAKSWGPHVHPVHGHGHKAASHHVKAPVSYGAKADAAVAHGHGSAAHGSPPSPVGAQALASSGYGNAAGPVADDAPVAAAGGPVAGDDGEPIDFRKIGKILKNTPVLTEAAKHLAAKTWETKRNEEEFSQNVKDVPVGNMLPLAYAGLPKPDEALGFMPPGVDKALGLTDGPLENSDEVRLGAAPIKAPKPQSKAPGASRVHHGSAPHASKASTAAAAGTPSMAADSNAEPVGLGGVGFDLAEALPGAQPVASSAAAAGDDAGGQEAGDDGEPIDFRKMGNIMKNAPVLTEAAKHLAGKTWENKQNEEEISHNAADIPVANILPLAYHGKPKPDSLGFMPPGVDKALGLTDGPLENSDEVRLEAAPIKAPKPLSKAP